MLENGLDDPKNRPGSLNFSENYAPRSSSYSCMFIHYGQMVCINILSRVKDFLYHGYNNDGGYDIAFYRHGYEQAPNVRRYKSGKQQANSS